VNHEICKRTVIRFGPDDLIAQVGFYASITPIRNNEEPVFISSDVEVQFYGSND